MLLVHDDHKPTPDTEPKSIFDQFDEANNNRNGHTGDDKKYFPDMIAYMDKLIGNVVTKLDQLGLRENTLIVVMGDNGTKETFTHIWPDRKQYPGRKGGTADNGTHVPLILNYPGTIMNSDNKKFKTYDGLIDVTDIFPTICDAAKISFESENIRDGISFWPHIMGIAGEHRKVIYTWYNGNDPYTIDSLLLKYSFNKDFKYYAPSNEFPNGRFFDLRSDRLERSGKYFKERRWKVRLYSGLELDSLTGYQKQSYEYLKMETEKHEYVAVDSIKIIEGHVEIKSGEKRQISHKVFPANATRKNVIWESDDPEIASIDKFGQVWAHRRGEVYISIYSWDDAYPTSANEELTFHKNGKKDKIKISIQ
jgi:hypothetical protein